MMTQELPASVIFIFAIVSPRNSDWGLAKKIQASLKDYQYNIIYFCCSLEKKRNICSFLEETGDYSTKGYLF